MCPACIASAATLAVSVTSGGGILALARFRKLKSSLRLNPKEKVKEKQS